MIQGGIETIIGVNRDPVFGQIIMVGLGGIFVEILGDVSLQRAPFGNETAKKMLQSLKGYPLLAGARGQAPADIDALAEAIAQLSVFADANQDTIESIDINPFLVLPEGQGAVAVDALIIPRNA
jgi:Acyl-CoA synthetase (NDP forming)